MNDCSFVEGMYEEVKDRLDRGAVRKFLSVHSDSKRVKGLKKTLGHFLQDFQVNQLIHAIWIILTIIQVHLEIVQSMNVLEILEWTKVSLGDGLLQQTLGPKMHCSEPTGLPSRSSNHVRSFLNAMNWYLTQI